MSFMDVVYEEAPTGRRADLAPYREVFDNLVPGKAATMTVDKGDPVLSKITDEYGDPILDENGKEQYEDTGRGKIERQHEILFREVAKERGVGLTVGHQHFGDKTRLKLIVKVKRPQTPEQMQKRQQGAAQARYDRAVKKLVDKDGKTQAEAEKLVKAEFAAKAKAAAERAKAQAAQAAQLGKASSTATAPSKPATPSEASSGNGQPKAPQPVRK